jgi:transcriptional regulator with XRE-family HTH domain
MLSVDSFKSLDDYRQQLAGRVKAIRLAADLTQEGLASRSGVSLGSLKRFEATGKGSVDLLVKVAIALRFQDGLDGLFHRHPAASLDDLLELERRRRRGRKR